MKKTILSIFVVFVIISANAQKENEFKDSRDNHIYKTVKIGNQVWMSENLWYFTDSCTIYKWFTLRKYGCLYKWEDAQNVCPYGFHLPSKDEFKILQKYFSGNGTFSKKEYRKLISHRHNGFSVVFAGARDKYGYYYGIHKRAEFWSSTAYGEGSKISWFMFIKKKYKQVGITGTVKETKMSVRCIQDK